MTARLPERDSGTIRPATEEADQRSDFLNMPPNCDASSKQRPDGPIYRGNRVAVSHG
jgi:hypothetical protein